MLFRNTFLSLATLFSLPAIAQSGLVCATSYRPDPADAVAAVNALLEKKRIPASAQRVDGPRTKLATLQAPFRIAIPLVDSHVEELEVSKGSFLPLAFEWNVCALVEEVRGKRAPATTSAKLPPRLSCWTGPNASEARRSQPVVRTSPGSSATEPVMAVAGEGALGRATTCIGLEGEDATPLRLPAAVESGPAPVGTHVVVCGDGDDEGAARAALETRLSEDPFSVPGDEAGSPPISFLKPILATAATLAPLPSPDRTRWSACATVSQP